jgi:hypothetical protein
MRILHDSHTLGCLGRKNSTSSVGCHESEESECGESVGLYVVYIRERGEHFIFILLRIKKARGKDETYI